MGRMEKVNEQIKREIGRILQQEMSDPRVEFVSITHVHVSKDLRNARVYYSVLGESQKAHEDAQKSLDGARGKIRKILGSQLNLRNVPELLFSYDDTLEASDRIDQTIQELHHESEET